MSKPPVRGFADRCATLSTMYTLLRLRRLGVALIALAVITTACSATESVTITDAAVAAATSTARTDPVDSPLLDSPLPDDPADDPADEEPTDDPADSPLPDDPADDPADEEPTAVPTVRPTTGQAASGENSCRFTFIDDFGDVQIELAFTSSLDRQDDATVEYVVFDGTGAELVRSSTFVEDLMPGEQVRLQVDTVEDEPTVPAARQNITCEFLGLDPFSFGEEPIRPQSGDSCRFLEVDSFGDIQIEVDVASPFDSGVKVAIDFAIRGPGGVRFGDGVGYASLTGADGRITERVDTYTNLPDWVNEASFSCEILAIEEF